MASLGPNFIDYKMRGAPPGAHAPCRVPFIAITIHTIVVGSHLHNYDLTSRPLLIGLVWAPKLELVRQLPTPKYEIDMRFQNLIGRDAK